MKFTYRYLIYTIYSWSANKKNDTPVGHTILALGVVHFFQLMTVLLIIDKIVFPIKWIWGINKTYLFFGALLFFVLFGALLYNKKRWNSYIKEFENESERDRKLGNLWVVIFLIGSIVLFFISLPILYSIRR